MQHNRHNVPAPSTESEPHRTVQDVRLPAVGSPAVIGSLGARRNQEVISKGRSMRVLARCRSSAMRVTALAGVILITLFAAGCAKADPSAVAYVGNTKITQQQLDDALEGVSAILQEGQSVSQAAVVNALIHGAIAAQLAAEHNISITDADRDAVIKNSNIAGLLNVPKGRPLAYDIADQQIVSGKLGSSAYLAAVGKEPVTLNPRYGVLDPSQKTIINDKSASLAKSVPTPTPTP